MARTLYSTAHAVSTATAGNAKNLEDRIEELGALVNEHAAALDELGAPAAGSASETITTGAASLLTVLTKLSTTGTKAYTLADGLVAGQRKIFEEVTAATLPAGTLTVATMDTAGGGAGATFVFNTAGQRLELIWTGTAWHIERLVPAGLLDVVVGTTVLTGYVMNSTLKLSVTGTVHSTTTKGIPNGRIPGQRLHVGVGTVASSPVGDIAITALTRTTIAAATSLANLTDTTMSAGFEWNGSAWQCVEFVAGTGVATLS